MKTRLYLTFLIASLLCFPNLLCAQDSSPDEFALTDEESEKIVNDLAAACD